MSHSRSFKEKKKELFDFLQRCSRLAFGLPKFLHRPMNRDDEFAEVTKRMERREANFLKIVGKAIYGFPQSPYLLLLQEAGCTYGDISRLVSKEGLEETLSILKKAGVYISLDEFKGKKEVVRGSRKFSFVENDFDNPFSAHHFEATSGGTRSAGTRVMLELDFISSMISDTAVLFEAHKLWNTPQAVWWHTPAASIAVLIYTNLGSIPLKWFSPVDTRSEKLPFRFKSGLHLLLRYARLLGFKLPIPEYAPINEPRKIALWLADTLKTRGSCSLSTFPSSAVRICSEAKKEGISLDGVSFITIGEPMTEAGRKEILSAHARPLPCYGFAEGGAVGFACGTPEAPDDMHFMSDNLAVIQAQKEVLSENIRVPAFYFSSLLPTSPKILLNVDIGDYGVIKQRKCGCFFNDTGYHTHLSGVQSYEKFNSEGVTFIGTDFQKIIEEVLPERFGGRITDYQVVEQNDTDGLSRISLIVSPHVGEINEQEVVNTFLKEIGSQSEMNKIFSRLWSQSSSIQVERRLPYITPAGKIFPFHLIKGR